MNEMSNIYDKNDSDEIKKMILIIYLRKKFINKEQLFLYEYNLSLNLS